MLRIRPRPGARVASARALRGARLTTATLAAVIATTAASAQDTARTAADSTPRPTLAPVTVSASRGSPIERLDLSTTVVSRARVQLTPQQGVEQILNKIPGVFVPQVPATQTHPTAQILSLRGFGTAFGVKTLVMVDGVPVNDGYFRTIDWSQIPKESIDRIEVIRGGGATSLWGNLAMGGVINIVTRQPERGEARLTTSYGTYDTFHASAAATLLATDRLRIGVDLARAQSDGYFLVPSVFRNARNAATASQANNGMLSAAFTPSPRATFYAKLLTHAAREDGLTWDVANNRWRKAEARAGGTVEVGERGSVNVAGWVNRVRFETQNTTQVNRAGGAYNIADPTNGVPYIAQKEPARHHTVGGSAFYQTRRGALTDLKVGVDARLTRIDDHNDIYNATGANTASFDAEGEHRFEGIFAQATVRPPGTLLDVTLGLRGDFWQAVGGEIRGTSLRGPLTNPLADQDYARFDPRLGLKYYLPAGLALRAAAYRNFSAPGMNQMYRSYVSNTTYNNASPAIRPETNSGVETGIDFTRGPVNLSVTGFRNWVDGYIDYPSLCTTAAACAPFVTGTGLTGITGVRQYLNAGDAIIEGLELLASWQAAPNVRFDGGVTRTAAWLTRTDYPASAPAGKQIGQIPALMTNVGASWQVVPTVALTAQLKSWPAYWYNTAHTTRNDRATIGDVSVAWQYRSTVQLFAAAQNVGNARYYDVGAQGTGTPPTLGQPFALTGGVRLAR